jgi:hypothetical protein
MAQTPPKAQSGDVSGRQNNRHLLKRRNQMNKFMTATLLTVVAVPFLMAAPAATKKAQNTATPATTTATTKKVAKKHVKKAKTTAAPVAPAAK